MSVESLECRESRQKSSNHCWPSRHGTKVIRGFARGRGEEGQMKSKNNNLQNEGEGAKISEKLRLRGPRKSRKI